MTAQASSIDSEQINYGSACTGNVDAADWDTIAECSSSQWKRGPFFFGTNTDTCDGNHGGMIRYNTSSKVMEYCNTSAWTTLSGTAGTGDYASVVNAAQIDAGYDSSCFITTTNALYCMGFQASGLLGNGVNSSSYSTKPLAVSGSYSWSKVSIGNDNACGITTGNVLYCWGANPNGEIGDGTTTTRTTPTLVSGSYTWTDIAMVGVDNGLSSAYNVTSTNMLAACGIVSGGAAYCWGDNTVGQLGTGNNTASKTPVAVTGGYTFTSMSRSGGGTQGHICGIASTGAAYCWGANNNGQLGNNSTTNSNAPALVSGGLSWTALVTGPQNTCGITSTSAAYCWGLGTSGQLGNGTSTSSLVPVLVSGGYSWSKLGYGDAFGWGITTTGALYGWGLQEFGYIGTASVYNTPQLVTFSNVTGTKWVDVNASHNLAILALRDNGALYSTRYTTDGMSGVPGFGSLILMQ